MGAISTHNEACLGLSVLLFWWRVLYIQTKDAQTALFPLLLAVFALDKIVELCPACVFGGLVLLAGFDCATSAQCYCGHVDSILTFLFKESFVLLLLFHRKWSFILSLRLFVP